MQIVESVVSRPVEACWRVFTNAATLPSWVPGLRSARVVEERDGRPYEVVFEFVTGSVYSLVYRYDLQDRVVYWEPRRGERGGVSGSARFEDIDQGTRFTYSIEQEYGRIAAERALDDAHGLVEAFTRWMDEGHD